MKLIVAVDENWGIGKNNELLCHLPDDMKNFRKITTGKKIVMGRKTLESFPNGKPLKNRVNIVLSSNEIKEDVIVCHTIEDALRLCDENTFIIGGGSIYKQFFPYCNEVYITRIHENFNADTFFPPINEDEWILTDKSEIMNQNNIDFHFEIWKIK